MNIQELQKQIIANNLDDLYVFIGDEIAIQKIYINKIASTRNLEIQYIDEFKQIYNKLKINQLFDTKKLYVILDDYDILKYENIWNNIQSNGNIIIFKYNTLDKRNKFYKYFEAKIVEFNKLSVDVLTKYIHKETGPGTKLDDTCCKQLIDMCNCNYNQILLELDKLLNYRDVKNQGDDINYLTAHFNELSKLGAFHKEVSDITFEFIEKVIIRDVKSIYNLYKQLHQINESNLKLLSLLYTNFKIILLIQSCKSTDICKTTGLQYYQVKYNQNKINYYTIPELVYILRTIQKLEKGIKIGEIDESISLDYLLVNIL